MPLDARALRYLEKLTGQCTKELFLTHENASRGTTEGTFLTLATLLLYMKSHVFVYFLVNYNTVRGLFQQQFLNA
jgi:hypothetical protein